MRLERQGNLHKQSGASARSLTYMRGGSYDLSKHGAGARSFSCSGRRPVLLKQGHPQGSFAPMIERLSSDRFRRARVFDGTAVLASGSETQTTGSEHVFGHTRSSNERLISRRAVRVQIIISPVARGISHLNPLSSDRCFLCHLENTLKLRSKVNHLSLSGWLPED